jgi:hypothetical protein
MISRKDLVLKKHTSGTNELLASLSARRLISLVKHWFNVPELRPTHKSAQFAIYEGFLKKKSSVIERILSIDWVKSSKIKTSLVYCYSCFFCSLEDYIQYKLHS